MDSTVLLEDKDKDLSTAEQRAETPVDSTVLLEKKDLSKVKQRAETPVNSTVILEDKDNDLSTVKQRAETHVDERSLASCVRARFPDTVMGSYTVWKA